MRVIKYVNNLLLRGPLFQVELRKNHFSNELITKRMNSTSRTQNKEKIDMSSMNGVATHTIRERL